jgi:uridine kinase
VRVLLTGMSGTGKSTLVRELRRRGLVAYDADDDGFTAPRPDGSWAWQVDRVTQLLAGCGAGPVFFAGCSDEQAQVEFDVRILLTAPEAVIVERLHTRTTNRFGRDASELRRVLSDLREVEPLLRRSADLVVDGTAPTARVADLVVATVRRLTG